jgi:molybdate transport system ATP-binding protein
MLRVNVTLNRGAFRLDAHFDAPTPGVTALFGRSGCGKTTLVNLVAGLLREGEGRISLGDEIWLDSTRNICVAAEQRGIGYVFQDARLFPHYTVRGNLLYGARRSLTAASPATFDDIVALLGLEPLLQRRPTALSGGERQRVALGRALLAQPRLLLLDEPLASLDASRREEVLPYLEQLRDHYAIPMVFVSHRFDEVLRLATHMIVMDNGQITAAGDVGNVSLSPALRSIVGQEAVGAVVEGRVIDIDAASALASVAVGSGIFRMPAQSLKPQQSLRLQLLARDIILAVHEPRGLSVRNQLRGTVTAITNDGTGDLIELDTGGARLLARITTAATTELALAPGSPVWILVKAVSVSRHAGPAPLVSAPALCR